MIFSHKQPRCGIACVVVKKALRNAWLLQCFVLSTSHFKGSQKAFIFSRNVYETTAPRLFRLQFLSWQGSVHLSTVILAGYSDWTLQSQFYFFFMSNSLPQVSDPQTDTPRLPGCFSKWLRVCLHWQSMSSIVPGPTSCRSQLFSINCPFCLGKACKLLQFLVLSLSSPTQSLWGKKVNGGWRFWTESQSRAESQSPLSKWLRAHWEAQKTPEKSWALQGPPGMSMCCLTIPGFVSAHPAPLADSEDRTPAICMCLLGCYDAMSKNLGHKAVAWGMREGGVGKTHVPLLNPVSLCWGVVV